MSAFDDLTLGEVELLTTTCLGGKSLADADPMMLAGAVMWVTERKTDPTIEWETFKNNVRMADIKSFSIQMQADELDPLGQSVSTS